MFQVCGPSLFPSKEITTFIEAFSFFSCSFLLSCIYVFHTHVYVSAEYWWAMWHTPTFYGVCTCDKSSGELKCFSTMLKAMCQHLITKSTQFPQNSFPSRDSLSFLCFRWLATAADGAKSLRRSCVCGKYRSSPDVWALKSTSVFFPLSCLPPNVSMTLWLNACAVI